jgi:hypothetical protein
MSPAGPGHRQAQSNGGRCCVLACDRALLRDRLPKNHRQSPASPQGPPAAPQAPIFRILCRRPPATMLRRERAVTLVPSSCPPPPLHERVRVLSSHRRPQYSTDASNVCIYYCSTYFKAVRVGGGGQWRTCATRDAEPRPVWTSLPIAH